MCIGLSCNRAHYALGMCKRHYRHAALGKPLVELFDINKHCAKGHKLNEIVIVKGRPTRRCKQCAASRATAYRERYPERSRARTNSWRKNNREKFLALCRYARHIRRIRAVARLGSWTVEQWNSLKESFENKCLACGLSEAALSLLGRRLSPDHIRSLAKGGTNDLTNIQPFCHGKGGCNNRKHTKWVDYRGGFALEII